MMTRREAIQKTLFATAAFSAGAITAQTQPGMTPPAATPAPTGPFKLPPLPYPYDALEPHIDAQTMQIHHDKHHAAYVANLNKAVSGHPDLTSKSVEELVAGWEKLPEDIRTAVRNNGGGHLNHYAFWLMMKKNSGATPKGQLAAAMGQDKLHRRRHESFRQRLGLALFGWPDSQDRIHPQPGFADHGGKNPASGP